MFNWPLFFILVSVCVPGILVSIPNSIKTIRRLTLDKAPSEQTLPSIRVLTAVAVAQSLIVFAIPAAIGTAVAHRVGLRAPFFEALVNGEPLWPAIAPQLAPALGIGIAGALVFVLAYYGIFRRRLDSVTVQRMEELRNDLGIAGRLLYGGIAEEVLARWGLMSLLAWLGSLLAESATPAVMWSAIIVSGLLFGLGHAPSYLAAGCQKTPTFFAAMICLNLWASLVFGWLFWQYGLLAAMIAHMVFHLVWLPFDMHYYDPVEQPRLT